eukprot:ANDGO_01630.mRNA.1 hypothetical protein
MQPSAHPLHQSLLLRYFNAAERAVATSVPITAGEDEGLYIPQTSKSGHAPKESGYLFFKLLHPVSATAAQGSGTAETGDDFGAEMRLPAHLCKLEDAVAEAKRLWLEGEDRESARILENIRSKKNIHKAYRSLLNTNLLALSPATPRPDSASRTARTIDPPTEFAQLFEDVDAANQVVRQKTGTGEASRLWEESASRSFASKPYFLQFCIFRRIASPSSAQLMDAEAAAMEILRNAPLSGDVWFTLGVRYLEHAKYEEANKLIHSAIYSDPLEMAFWLALVNCYILSGDPTKALVVGRKALHVNRHPLLLNAMAVAHVTLGNLSEADQLFSESLSQQDFPEVQSNSALPHLYRRDCSVAIRILEQAVASFPNSALLQSNMRKLRSRGLTGH